MAQATTGTIGLTLALPLAVISGACGKSDETLTVTEAGERPLVELEDRSYVDSSYVFDVTEPGYDASAYQGYAIPEAVDRVLSSDATLTIFRAVPKCEASMSTGLGEQVFYFADGFDCDARLSRELYECMKASVAQWIGYPRINIKFPDVHSAIVAESEVLRATFVVEPEVYRLRYIVESRDSSDAQDPVYGAMNIGDALAKSIGAKYMRAQRTD